MSNMNKAQSSPLMVLAIGGNALIAGNDQIEMSKQRNVAKDLAKSVVNLIEHGWRVVLTHGNGPHVGMHLMRDELSKNELPKSPLDHFVSSTQGEIGYLLQLAIKNELLERNIQKEVVSLVTQVEVSESDNAFSHPDKPVGVFMDQESAEKSARELGWTVVEDSGRGWRRVVPSPQPLKILELDVIKSLIADNHLVIACGGGGIPVAKHSDGHFVGVEAVIDKDRVSALLASSLEAEVFLIPTGVEQVAINFGKENQTWLSSLTVAEAEQYKSEGQFPAGSMLPKIESILSYLKSCPKGNGIVTTLEVMAEAVDGTKGTRIHQ